MFQLHNNVSVKKVSHALSHRCFIAALGNLYFIQNASLGKILNQQILRMLLSLVCHGISVSCDFRMVPLEYIFLLDGDPNININVNWFQLSAFSTRSQFQDEITNYFINNFGVKNKPEAEPKFCKRKKENCLVSTLTLQI